MEDLTEELIKMKALISPQIKEAFFRIDRRDFVLLKYQDLAYENIPLPICCGQTISQPATVAFMMELLQPKEGEKILDVGSGSGWTTAILSYIVGEKGKVIGVEIVEDLVLFGRENLSKYKMPQAEIVRAGKTLGFPAEAPYDKILVSAFAVSLPEELVSQLKNNGTMIIPIGESIWKIRKDKNGIISKEEYPGFAFVPLIN